MGGKLGFFRQRDLSIKLGHTGAIGQGLFFSLVCLSYKTWAGPGSGLSLELVGKKGRGNNQGRD